MITSRNYQNAVHRVKRAVKLLPQIVPVPVHLDGQVWPAQVNTVRTLHGIYTY